MLRSVAIADMIDQEILENVPVSSSRIFSATDSPAKPKATKPTTTAPPKKRPSPATENPPKKRQKKSLPKESSEKELSSNPAGDSEAEPVEKKSRLKSKAQRGSVVKGSPKKSQINGKPRSKPKNQQSDSELSDAAAEDFERADAPQMPGDDSGSDLSVLLDEKPAPKKKQKSKGASEKPKNSAKVKPAVVNDPDQEEIKRLQGWLVKCGIRKIWAFELKPYETSKAKIKHLREMLSDVGMTGRYSLEKASQIKEARELAADIEAVQEGNEIWGKDGEERSRRSKRSNLAEPENDEDADNAPKKKLVRGPKRYDFLSSDGEESD